MGSNITILPNNGNPPIPVPTQPGGLSASRSFSGGISNDPVPTPSNGAQLAIFILKSRDAGISFMTNVTKEPISGSRSANYQHQPIMNRSSDVITYSNSSNPTLEVSIELFAIQTNQDEQNIITAMNMLRALTLPMQSGVQGPPLCQITLGAGYKGLYKNWNCVLTSVGETFEVDAGFSTNYQSRVIGVKLSFMGVETDSVDWSTLLVSTAPYTDPDWSNSGTWANVSAQNADLFI